MRRLTPGTRPLLRTATVLALGAFGLLAGCASLPPGTQRDARDPLERVNRSMFKFDDALVNNVARPVDKAWTAVTPAFLRQCFANVFANAHLPAVMLNDLLQGRFGAAGYDFARLAINTTFGIGGLIDAATWGHVPKNDNDFGRTLGTWGVPSGPYLVLPFYGPSTLRDFAGMVPDGYANPQNYIQNTAAFYGTYSLKIITDVDQAVIPTYDLLDQQHPFDPYAFARNAYLQRRDFQIHGEHQDLDQQELELQQSLQDDPDSSTPKK